MHTNEVEIDAALVRRLLEEQFPQWATLPLAPVESAGTDNAIFRMGDELVARDCPRIEWAVRQVDIERTWMPRLAPSLPLEIPTPVATGTPGADYPWEWAIHRWIPGENFAVGRVDGLEAVALDVARFLVALRSIDPNGGPPARPGRRGGPLAPLDTVTRRTRSSNSATTSTSTRHSARGTCRSPRGAWTTTRSGSTPTCCRAT